MDIALIFADGGPKGKADPAFDAHMMPIGEWALACWENWATEVAMEAIIKVALAMVAKGKNRWATVYGPGAALVMTCIRIEWQVVSARHLVTHEGEMLDLKLDPPAVVLLKVADAVRRWRWKKIENICPQLAVNGSGRGAVMEPLMAVTGNEGGQQGLE